LDGSTLDRISAEAGVARPMLRHYLGNREQMVGHLLEHVGQVFAAETDQLFDFLPETQRMDALFDAVFTRKLPSSENAAVFQALVAASDRYDGIRDMLLTFVYQFEAKMRVEIQREKPNADPMGIEVAAAGLTAITFNVDATLPLLPEEAWRARQRDAAQMLLRGL
jgi:AcrR family transcriptional regulator